MKTSRRDFVRTCSAALLTPRLLSARQTGPAHGRISLDGDWLFGGQVEDAAKPPFDDHGFAKITLPHCVARLSWQDWNPSVWEHVWAYQRHFSVPTEFRNSRVFLQFDGVMVGASPAINGHALPEHLGGYVPFHYEVTEWLTGGANVLSLAVDSRWLNVPPEGSRVGPRSIDYLEPGGILRPVSLCAVPQIFLSDVFAKPVNVLDPGRHVVVSCSIDAVSVPDQPVQLKTELRNNGRVISTAQRTLKLEAAGKSEVVLTLSNLGNIALWDAETPHLYDVVTTLALQGKPVHEYRTRLGLREARFDVDGFFLNGRRFQLFGLNRHELFPYVGAAMPRRVLRRDAEILRRDLNCNIVRCSHYPQSDAFLDACDELGLMVWEEIPGWQFLGNDAWKELALRDVREMVTRDRNHPSIIIWGVRINESANDPALYSRTRELAHSLDDSRPTSGSMTPTSTKNWQEQWHQDVFAFDDYHSAPDKSVGILDPLPGVPYVLAEAVGQYNYAHGRGFDAKYRRTGDVVLQQAQALRHAQAHDRGMALPRLAGIIAWCAFDYGSLVNADHGVKCPGVYDVFRIPKLGAAFYLAQLSPEVRPVIQPDFYWDFGPEMPLGPGKNAVVFSNCDRLEIFIDGEKKSEALPDRTGFPHLKYPPFLCDLSVEGAVSPELRIDGYLAGKLLLSRSFSSDRGKDQFSFAADDQEIIGDGSDATRVYFETVDRFGAMRPFAAGEVQFVLTGPGVIIGDNPFHLKDAGGVGAIWIKSQPNSSGRIVVEATHSTFGKKSVTLRVAHVD